MVSHKATTIRGISLIEVLVAAAVMLVVFGGLFTGVRYSLDLVSTSRAKLTALTLVNDRMEYIRSLSYDDAGTLSGIPAGLIPQNSTSTLNGIEFAETVLIEYVDDVADGLGVADANGITTDYKQVKVTLRWLHRGIQKELFLVSSIIPRSIETDVGGGTLRVNVFDANVTPLPGATVRLVNNTLVPAIDVTRTSDASGVALFGGAPAGPDYEVIVTAVGYSTDQTYTATTTLPNPTTRPVAVLEADVSTLNFFIDELSTLTVHTYSSLVSAEVIESFTDATGIATSSETVVAAGSLQLAGGVGSFAASGASYLDAVTPTVIDAWGTLSVVATNTAATAVIARFYTGTSTYTLIPESDVPGNAVGFSDALINLSGLDVGLYPSITVGLFLTSSNVNESPTVGSVTLQYLETKDSLANVPFTLRSFKTLGTGPDAVTPVYKNTLSNTTNVSGERVLTDVEWDSYLVTAGGYDIAEACPANPVAVSPGVTETLELVLAADTTNTLRVAVMTSSGAPLVGATVSLARGGSPDTISTSQCGQVFYEGLTGAADYTLTVSVSGYTTQTFTDFEIVGDVVQVVSF